MKKLNISKRILSVVLIMTFLMGSFVAVSSPMNLAAEARGTYMPLWSHVPDGDPHIMHDPDDVTKKRVFLFGSHDLSRAGQFCSYDIVAWSAPVEDISDWRYEGPACTFVRNSNNLPTILFAPAAAEIKRKISLKTDVDRSAYQDNQKLTPSDYDDRQWDEYPSVFYDKKNDCGFAFDYYMYPHPNGITWLISHSKGSLMGPYEPVNADANSNRLTILEDGTATQSINGFDPGVYVDIDEDGYPIRAYLWWAGFDTIQACELDLRTMASPVVRQEYYDQDTSGKYNMTTGIKRDFIPVAGVSNYSNVHTWAIDNNINPLDPTKNKFDVLDPENLELYRLFEAAYPTKMGNKWVVVYSGYGGPEYGANSSNAMKKYIYSDNPLGPWRYGGVVIDSRGLELDQNGNIMSVGQYGNSHGGVIQVGSEWYAFAHRTINTGEWSRINTLDRVFVDIDEEPGGAVTIMGIDPETKGPKVLTDVNGNTYTGVDVSTSGHNLEGLNPYRYVPAGLAYWVTPERITDNVPLVEHNPFMTYTQATYDMHEDAAPIVNIRNGSIMGWKYFNFSAKKPPGTTPTIDIYATPKGVDLTLDIMMDTPWPAGTPNAGIKLGELRISKDAEQVQTKYTVRLPQLDNVTGRKGIYFVCRSGNANKENLQLAGFVFGREELLLYDNFVSLNNWKVTAGATVPSGVLTLGNNAELESTRGASWQNYEFTADIKAITGNLAIRFMKNGGKYYELAASQDGKLILSSVDGMNVNVLAEMAAGALKLPATVSISVADGVINIFANDVRTIRVENDDYDFGSVGFATDGSGGAEINSVTVRTATDRQVATSAMTIMVDGVSVPLPVPTAATAQNAYSDSGNYDLTYAHGNESAPVITASCTDSNVRISVQQPQSATDMAIVRASKGPYTKTFRIMLAKGATVTGEIRPVLNGKAFADPTKAASDILDIFAGQDLTGNWRLDLSVIVDHSLNYQNGYAVGTRAGIGLFGSANNYYEISAQRHPTADSASTVAVQRQTTAGVNYSVNGVKNSANDATAYQLFHMQNTRSYYEMITYNLRLTKTGNSIQGSNNRAAIAYTNTGTAQTFAAEVFDSAKLQLFATNPSADSDLRVKYVATLIKEDFVDTNTLPASAATGSITPVKGGRNYGDPLKDTADVVEIDLRSHITQEILDNDWQVSVRFTPTPSLQSATAGIQVGVGMSAAAEPERNFFQVHAHRNGTSSNYLGSVAFARDSATSTSITQRPANTGSTLAPAVVRLTRLNDTLRGAYATTNATTWMNIGGTAATAFPTEFFKDGKLYVFATNPTQNDFKVNYEVIFAPIRTPRPVSYDQLAVEIAADIIGEGIAVRDTDPGADDRAKAQEIIDDNTELDALAVARTITGTGSYRLDLSKGASSMHIAPYIVLNVTNKGWNQFDTLVNTTIPALSEEDYTKVSWNRLQNALSTVKDITPNSSSLAIGLAYDRVKRAEGLLDAFVADAVIVADGINNEGYTSVDSVEMTVTEAPSDAIANTRIFFNGGAGTATDFVASGEPFKITTAAEGKYYFETTTAKGRVNGFTFTVDKTAPVITYDDTAKILTVNDANLMSVTVNGQTVAVTKGVYTTALSTDQYEVWAEDKAGNINKLVCSDIDKSALQDTIQTAIGTVGDSLIDYTIGSANEYLNALNAAQALNINPDAKQIEIDYAVLRIENAISGLVSRVELRNIIAEAEALNLDDYMPWQVRFRQGAAGNTTTNFLIELEQCRVFYNLPNYTAANIRWAIDRLRAQMNDLVSRVPLREKLAEADEIISLKSAAYTDGSIQALQTAITTADTFYHRTTNTTQAQLTAAVTALNTAIVNLVPVVRFMYDGVTAENVIPGKALSVEAKFDVSDNTPITMYLAMYNENGAITKVTSVKGTINGGIISFDSAFEIPAETENGAYLKVFFWDSQTFEPTRKDVTFK